jgi:putative transposase
LKHLADTDARHSAARKEFAARGEKLPRRPSDGKPITFPRFKARHRSEPAFTIPDNVKMRDGRLRVPKVGWLRLGPLRLYADCQLRTVRVRREAHGGQPRWYACNCYTVPVDHPDIVQPAADGALGLDRNVGQATDSDGIVYEMPDTGCLDTKIARRQRELSRKRSRGPKTRGQPKSNRGRRIAGQLTKLNRKRDDATHQTSRKLTNTAHTVVVEDRNTKSMTVSAQGTVEELGRQVAQKTDLNRAILASGWRGLERKLAYKADEVLKGDPAYTSQACSRCGHTDKSNRPSRAVYRCGACGFRLHADHNAAVNILVRAGLPPAPVHGPGARGTARRGAIPLGTPASREQGCRLTRSTYRYALPRRPNRHGADASPSTVFKPVLGTSPRAT